MSPSAPPAKPLRRDAAKPLRRDAAKPLRRDAAENREKVLDAASRVFAERGLDATVDEVAREAGVGMGTLYRRFPHKQALIDELVGGVRRALRELAVDAVAEPDGVGLELLLVRVGELQAGQPGCLTQLWTHSDTERAMMEDFRSILGELLVQAQAAGRVRADVAGTDVTMIMWSLRGLIEMTRDTAPQAWRRHLELVVAGLRPPGEAGFVDRLSASPLSADDALRISAAVPGRVAPAGRDKPRRLDFSDGKDAMRTEQAQNGDRAD